MSDNRHKQGIELTCPTCGRQYTHTLPDASRLQRLWYGLKWRYWKAPNCSLECAGNEASELLEQ